MIFGKLFGTRPDRQSDDAREAAEARPGAAASAPLAIPCQREVYTSTAAIVVYDIASLRHRLDDDVDWWADPAEEVRELRSRTLLIVGVGADDFYDIEVSDAQAPGQHAFSLAVPSGQIFIGPGEELTGGGDEPGAGSRGFFITLNAGDYAVSVTRVDERLSIGFVEHAPFENPAQPVVL